MKHRFVTLFLPFCLFVFSANRAEACGSDNTEHAADFHQKAAGKSCCSEKGQNDFVHCSQNEDACNQSHPGQSCPPDEDGCGGCHCPGCGTVGYSGATFALETQAALIISILNTSVQKQAFYFADHLPEAVYLPIWQPPKIGA